MRSANVSGWCALRSLKMIRCAEINDAEGIAQIHVETWQDAYKNIIPTKFLSELSVSSRTDSWTEQISDSTTQIVVHTEDDQILGFLAGGVCRDSDLTNHSEIYAIYVSPKHQNQGIGKTLATHFLQSLSQNCSLWVLADNTPSIGFYQTLGFKHDGTTKELQIQGKTIMEIRLTQALSPANKTLHPTSDRGFAS